MHISKHLIAHLRYSLNLILEPVCRTVSDLWFQVGTYAMESTLLKYGAKDYFFKAVLCNFCVDMLNAKVSMTTIFVCVS